MDDTFVKGTGYFNIFECGKNILNKIDATCERACMENPRDKYYTELFRTITYCNDSNSAPLSNENIRYAIHRVIAEEKLDVHNITSDTHNVTVDNFSQTSNTQREKKNTILTSEKRDKSDALEKTLKGLTINDAGYYESDSANANDTKIDPASNPEIATQTSDIKKRKVTDTRNRDFQQKLLSNRTLTIITATIDPRIDDMVATCGASPHKLATPQMTEVITDMSCSRAWILRTPRYVRWTDRDGNTPGKCDIAVRSPRDNSPVLIGGIGVYLASGHSGILKVLNKRPSTVSHRIRYTQKFDASVDRKLSNDGYYTSIFSKVIGLELSQSSSSDLYL